EGAGARPFPWRWGAAWRWCSGSTWCTRSAPRRPGRRRRAGTSGGWSAQPCTLTPGEGDTRLRRSGEWLNRPRPARGTEPEGTILKRLAPTFPLETELLLLRAFVPGDFDALFAI